MSIWYALMKDRDDTDWGTGTYDKQEAIETIKSWRQDVYPDAYIAVIDESGPVCIDEITDFDEEERTMITVQFDATPDGNMLHAIHPGITAKAWCPVPEGASDDYGYLTLKQAIINAFPGNPDRLHFWYDGQEDKLAPDASADCTVYTDFDW